MNTSTAPSSPDPSKHATLRIPLDWRLIAALLAVTIGVMLYLWHPWQGGVEKTISVQGEAVVAYEPDSFRFQPVFTDADKQKATDTGNAAVAKLKELGVKPKDIKTSVTSRDATKPGDPEIAIYPRPTPGTAYSITFTVDNQDRAQKVADYLATTTASGQLTPQAELSRDARSKLDLQARQKASDDAKRKAEVMAKQLGSGVGRVIRVSEANGYDYTMSSEGRAGVATDSIKSAPAGPTVQPGTDEISYVFTVVFALQ